MMIQLRLLSAFCMFILSSMILLQQELIHAKTPGILSNIPFIPKKNKEYTPLLFFTAHKGELAACDEMEKIVSQVEKELDINIERLDVRRNRFYHKLYNIVDATNGNERSGAIPMLYHRESRQKICGVTSKDQVCALAKGMWLEELDFMKEERKRGAVSSNNNDEPSLEEMGLDDEGEGSGFELLD